MSEDRERAIDESFELALKGDLDSIGKVAGTGVGCVAGNLIGYHAGVALFAALGPIGAALGVCAVIGCTIAGAVEGHKKPRRAVLTLGAVAASPVVAGSLVAGGMVDSAIQDNSVPKS